MEFSEKMISEGITIPWTANSRVDIKEETLRRLKDANCRASSVSASRAETRQY